MGRGDSGIRLEERSHSSREILRGDMGPSWTYGRLNSSSFETQSAGLKVLEATGWSLFRYYVLV